MKSHKKQWESQISIDQNAWYKLNGMGITDNDIKKVAEEISNDHKEYNLDDLPLRKAFNWIGPIGCHFLARAEWQNLQQLYLVGNQIGDQGCRQLSKADWKKLRFLSLGSNGITVKGCMYLSQASWPKMQSLWIGPNKIGKKGYQILLATNWEIVFGQRQRKK